MLKNPSKTLRRLMEVLHLLVEPGASSKVSWQAVQVTLEQEAFTKRIRTCDVAGLNRHPQLARRLLDEYFSGPESLTFEKVEHASRGVLALFGWALSLVVTTVTQQEKAASEAEAKAKVQAEAEHAEANKGKSSGSSRSQGGKGKGKTAEETREHQIMSQVHKLIAQQSADPSNEAKGKGGKGGKGRGAKGRGGSSKDQKIPESIHHLTKAFLAAKKCRETSSHAKHLEEVAARAREAALSKPAPLLLRIRTEGETWKKELDEGHKTQITLKEHLRQAEHEALQKASLYEASAKKFLQEAHARTEKPIADGKTCGTSILEWPGTAKHIGFKPIGSLPLYTPLRRFDADSSPLGILTAACGPDAKVKNGVTGQVDWLAG